MTCLPSSGLKPRHLLPGVLPALVHAILAAAFAAVTAPVSAALPGFGTAGPVVVPASPRLLGPIVVADFDGDGRPDLATLDETGAAALRRGTGGGAFAPPEAIGVRPGAVQILAGDFDRDGRVDLLVQRLPPFEENVAAVSVLLGDGSGRFRETADSGRYPNRGRLAPVPLAAGDLDGDGVLDVATVTVDPDDGNRRLVVLLRGDGKGGFALLPYLRPELAFLYLAIADLDRDGVLDLLAPIPLHRGGAIYAMKGTGGFAFAAPTRAAGGDQFVVTDFNGDGIPDLATASTSFCQTCSAGVYLGDGRLGFQPAFFAFPGSYGYPGPVDAADVDGDGATDLLAEAGTEGILGIYPGDGRGGFGAPVRLREHGGFQVADLDGDGRPDLLFGRSSGWTVRRNTSGQGSSGTTLVVPVALSSPGEAGSYFTTRLTVTNRGETTAFLESTFTDATTGETTTGSRAVGAGDQWTSGLAVVGLPNPLYGYRGTIRVRVTGASSPDAVSILALVQSAVGTTGKVGVAFGAVPAASAFTGPSLVPWLREGDGDRSNLAVLNAGSAADGSVTLRVTVFPGEGGGEAPFAMPDVTLAPGAIRQFDHVLAAAGLASKRGWARVERVAGAAPYLAYAAVNDASNSDGSWVPAVGAERGRGETSLTVPVLVESDAYTSELVVTNASASAKRLSCVYVADAVPAPDHAVRFSLDLQAGSQVDWPAFVAALRTLGFAGLVPKGPRYAGALAVSPAEGDLEGVLALARTVNPAPAGRYGVATPALFGSELAAQEAWLTGLEQNVERRTNLAIVNAATSGEAVFHVELRWDSGAFPLGTIEELRVPAGGWLQLNSVLAPFMAGWSTTGGTARVVRISGPGPFLAYAVGNDGAGPGEGTGDGSYVPMQVPTGAAR